VNSTGPVVWAFLSYRAGESQQILGLAEAATRRLHGRLHVLRPSWTRPASLLGLLRRISPGGVDHGTRSELAAGTPDLFVTAGLRNEPVARWLAQRSRGRTLTVLLGRTWAPHDAFDLVVTTPQYRLPPHLHVLENAGTIHRLTAARLAEERSRWAERYAALPRPRLGVLVGGDSGPFHLGPRNAVRLAARARALAGAGSIMGTTSSRTPQIATRVLTDALPDADLWHWNAREENPYFGILAWADALLVTGDSIAMVSEAVATGKPVRIFDLGGMQGPGSGVRDETLGTRAYGLLMRHGHRRLSRDLTPAHDALIARGQAAWDDVPLPTPLQDGPGTPVTTDVDAALARITELLAARR
jgi:mitochondrial fission protein ELM1